MDAWTILHRLLYEALIDIRVAAYQRQTAPAFHIADLLHTLPVQLDRAARGEIAYATILADLRSRAHQKGAATEAWLAQRLPPDAAPNPTGDASQAAPRPRTQAEWDALLDATEGSLSDDPIERPAQGQYEQRDAIT